MKRTLVALLWFAVAMGLGGSTCTGDGQPDITPDGPTDAPPDGQNHPLAPGECRDVSDCEDNGESCLAPDDLGSCGICRDVKTPCEADSACDSQTTGQVCQPVRCACSPASECAPGCSTTGCAEGTTCNGLTERCEADPCQLPADCPLAFSCANAACVRTACTRDADCRAGYCVKGQCFDDPGTCQLPVP